MIISKPKIRLPKRLPELPNSVWPEFLMKNPNSFNKVCWGVFLYMFSLQPRNHHLTYENPKHYGTPLWNSFTHSAISDHETKVPSWQFFPTKYVIPQKFQVSPLAQWVQCPPPSFSHSGRWVHHGLQRFCLKHVRWKTVIYKLYMCMSHRIHVWYYLPAAAFGLNLR